MCRLTFSPINLQLSASQELVLEENINLLRSIGYELDFDSSRPVNQRARLFTVPICGKVTFKLEDLEEILGQLENNQESNSSRLDKAFASKACRSSVMIGDVLSRHQMNEIVSNLATLQQPWNCPHGRPTLKHLKVLK